MGNATGPGANAFQSLGAEELVFELLSSSDVGADGENRFSIAQGIANQGPMGMHKQFATRFGSLGKVPAPLGLLEQDLYGVSEPGKIRVKEFLGAASENFRLGPAMEPLGALTPVPEDTSHIRDDDSILSQVEQSGLLAQLLLLPAALGVFRCFIESTPHG